MSTAFARKMTDSQSKGHLGHIKARHRILLAGLVLAVADLGEARAVGPRGPDGECPWGDRVAPQGARQVFTYTGTAPATPEEIFPLLCPVLEYEWLDDWSCQMLYSESGVAEQGVAFRTNIQVGENWICSRFEPPLAIQYTVWLKVGWMVLDIQLTPGEDGRTDMQWTRTFTATKPLGRKLIGKMTDERVTGDMKVQVDKLVDYLQRQ